MQIQLTIGDTVLSATLVDNCPARDLAARLPLDLALRDFHETEKIAYLPERLSTTGSADGFDPSPGDLTYYAPWGNLALFYRDFGYSSGLVQLGRIDGDPSLLADVPDGTPLRIELR